MKQKLLLLTVLIPTILGGCSTKNDLPIEESQGASTDNTETIELQNSELVNDTTEDEQSYNSDMIEDDSKLVEDELEVEEKKESIYGFEDLDLPLMDPSKESLLKDQIWENLIVEDYQGAADLAYDAVHSYSFEESSDFINWYHDIYTVAAAANPDGDKDNLHNLLSSFETPRFQAVFPPFASVFVGATIIDDPDSLLPIDVESVQVLEEEILSPEDCSNISPYVDQMLIHFKDIYKATLTFYRRTQFYDEYRSLQEVLVEDTVNAYVGIFNNGRIKLLGYYGECDELKTDAYWEARRLDYAGNPYF
ncbi:hypothetical protein [Turicibacter bilis]|uniref:hypothetical protein n=1 Tax=Turicibacter bilis TaxID=2735723 RepID=UPI003F890360